MSEQPTSTAPLFAKTKAVEARAIERSRQWRAQESPPFSPEAPETATLQPTRSEVRLP